MKINKEISEREKLIADKKVLLKQKQIEAQSSVNKLEVNQVVNNLFKEIELSYKLIEESQELLKNQINKRGEITKMISLQNNENSKHILNDYYEYYNVLIQNIILETRKYIDLSEHKVKDLQIQALAKEIKIKENLLENSNLDIKKRPRVIEASIMNSRSNSIKKVLNINNHSNHTANTKQSLKKINQLKSKEKDYINKENALDVYDLNTSINNNSREKKNMKSGGNKNNNSEKSHSKKKSENFLNIINQNENTTNNLDINNIYNKNHLKNSSLTTDSNLDYNNNNNQNGISNENNKYSDKIEHLKNNLLKDPLDDKLKSMIEENEKEDNDFYFNQNIQNNYKNNNNLNPTVNIVPHRPNLYLKNKKQVINNSINNNA